MLKTAKHSSREFEFWQRGNKVHTDCICTIQRHGSHPDGLIIGAGEQLWAIRRKLHPLDPAQVSAAVRHLLIVLQVPQLQANNKLYLTRFKSNWIVLLNKQDPKGIKHKITWWQYLYGIVGEGDSQQVAGGTGLTVLHRAQAVRSDLKQHVWSLNIKHLGCNDKKGAQVTDADQYPIHSQQVHVLSVDLMPSHPPLRKEILTSTAFLAPQMMCLPSAVQVLHLTGTSSSPSVNRLLTSIVFHSLADATWKSWEHRDWMCTA